MIISRRRGKSKYTTNESVKFSKGSQYKPPAQLSTGDGKSAKDIETNSEHDEEQTYENTVFLGKKSVYFGTLTLSLPSPELICNVQRSSL